MSKPLILYTNPMSRGRIARWMLEEVGVPYDVEYVEYGPPMKGPPYRAINPMGKVPALRHGEAIVTEVAAICAYLADAVPEAGLAPPTDRRAAYYRWLFFGAGPLEAAVTNRALGVEVPPDRQGMVGYGSFERVVDTLEGALDGRDYIAGDRFTAADLYLGAQIGWGLRFGTIEARPALSAYAERTAARPAYARAMALDDAAMPKEKPA